MREISFYRSASGDCPVEAFLARLDGRQARKVAWVLRLVKDLPMVPKQYFKKLEGTQDIWEVRADLGNDAFRLMGFWDEGQLINPDERFCQKIPKSA